MWPIYRKKPTNGNKAATQAQFDLFALDVWIDTREHSQGSGHEGKCWIFCLSFNKAKGYHGDSRAQTQQIHWKIATGIKTNYVMSSTAAQPTVV